MYSTIVVGTDGSETANAAVAHAAELAKNHGAALHLVSAYRSRSGSVSVPIAGAATGDTGVGNAISQKVAEDMLGETAGRLGDLVAGKHVVGGDPADVVVSCAGEVGADLIVVGSKGMNRKVLGSVPNSVAHNAPCDVLIVKTA
jgi:nucleotide-binding universal stress UspA family protein